MLLVGATGEGGGVALLLLESTLALVGVCLLAVVLLRWAAGRGLGGARSGRAITVVDRVAIDARRSIVVVRVPGRLLLLGVGDAGAPTLLLELEPEGWPADEPPKSLEFRDILNRFRPSAPD